jgi:acetamidase/formamidase
MGRRERAGPDDRERRHRRLTPRVDESGCYGTTGVGLDLYAAAQDPVRAIVDHLAGDYGLSREDAYVLASLRVDL